MDTRSALERARQEAKQGNRRKAREILREAAKYDPKNEEIYLLFAQVADTKDNAIKTLEYVIKLNPNNQSARGLLEKIQRKSLREIDALPQKSKRKRLPWAIAGGAIIICLCSIFVVVLGPSSEKPSDGPTISEETKVAQSTEEPAQSEATTVLDDTPTPEPSDTPEFISTPPLIAPTETAELASTPQIIPTPSPTVQTLSPVEEIYSSLEMELELCCPSSSLHGEGVKIEGRDLIILTSLDRSLGLDTFFSTLGSIHGVIAGISPDVDEVIIDDVTGQLIIVEMSDLLSFYYDEITWEEYRSRWQIVNP